MCKHGEGFAAIVRAHNSIVRPWPLAVTWEAVTGLLQHLQDQYIEVNSLIPASATLFGAGEHISATGLPLRRDGVPLTLWTRDCAAADPDQNTYGSWPFLIDVRQGGLSPGMVESLDTRLFHKGRVSRFKYLSEPLCEDSLPLAGLHKPLTVVYESMRCSEILKARHSSLPSVSTSAPCSQGG
jgi:hypothetical protein